MSCAPGKQYEFLTEGSEDAARKCEYVLGVGGLFFPSNLFSSLRCRLGTFHQTVFLIWGGGETSFFGRRDVFPRPVYGS